MSRKTIMLEIAAEHEDLLRQYAGFLGEMKDFDPDHARRESFAEIARESVIETA